MRKYLKLGLALFTFLVIHVCNAANHQDNVQLLKNMFKNFAEERDISKFDEYYTKDFILESNNKNFSYPVYKKQQADIFKTLKSLKVIRYNDIFACDNKVVSRMRIQLIKKNGQVFTFDVILIATIKNNKIDRIWEITYPSWDDKLPSGKRA